MPFTGRIYRIDFPEGYSYYGKTKRPLKERLLEHKHTRMSELKNSMKPSTKFQKYLFTYGWNNPKISLVEEIIVNSNKELSVLENKYILEHFYDEKNLNEVCAGAIPTEEQKLKKLNIILDKQLNYDKKYNLDGKWREIWIERIIENWDKSPFLYSSGDAIDEYNMLVS
jgi:hypothetical protein